jgi:aldehyde dehydrogenase (NAD+)
MIPDLTTEKLEGLRHRFQMGVLATYEARIQLLKQLKQSILRNEEAIYNALQQDLHKSKEESWVTEIGITIAEINHALAHLKKWMRPKRVATNLVNLPSSSYLYPEPLGVVLVIGPWNYPFMLLLGPMVGALAAGNTVVVKPSEYAPATEKIIGKIIDETALNQEIVFAPGNGAVVVPDMMQAFRFDHVFFTGGIKVGKKIYEMAASQLVPVTLELGGKSPCIVEEDAAIEVAARRITVAKFSNAGQICIAPDYLLVHEAIRDRLIAAIRANLLKFYGDDPQRTPDYCRIINRHQFDRLQGYLKTGTILHGGTFNEQDLYIEPTLIQPDSLTVPIMQEEIFGPILPVLSFRTREEALSIIRQHPNPLAFYVFTSNAPKEEEWIRAIPAGTGCINNAAWQFTNTALPFGGRGDSGIGSAHGKFSFDRFTHYKAVMKTPAWFDPALKYPPMKGKLSLYKKVIG